MLLDTAKDPVGGNEGSGCCGFKEIKFVINRLPVISTCEPDAKTRLLLDPSAVPFPTMKADCAEDDILYCPCTCW